MGDSSRRLSRRRRANVPGGRHHSHEVKVTPEEEARLLQLAESQRVSVPRLLIESALAVPAGECLTERRDALVMLFGVQRLLAGIANNVNQIARATNATGEWQDETAATLAAVRRTSGRIDDAIDGLGLK